MNSLMLYYLSIHNSIANRLMYCLFIETVLFLLCATLSPQDFCFRF